MRLIGLVLVELVNLLVLLTLSGCGQMYWARADSKGTLERVTGLTKFSEATAV